MKKNVLKILLALVMVALVFAMVACNGDGNKPNNGGNTTKDCGDGKHVDTNNDGKCDKCGKDVPKTEEKVSLDTELKKLIGHVGPYVDTLKEVKKDSKVGIDVGLGAYYSYTGTNAAAGNFKLNVKGNLSANDPQAEIGLTLNGQNAKDDGEDYFKLGYKGGKIYITEALNKINNKNGSTVEANKMAMNVAAIEDGIKNVAGVGMEYLAYLGGLDALKNLDLVGLIDSLSEQIGGFDALNSFIKPNTTATATEFTINEEGVKCILGLLSAAGINLESYSGTIDTVLDYADRVLGFSQSIFGLEEGEKLTYALIMSNYLPSLTIRANYEGEALNSIDIAIAMNKINFEFGLSVKLATFGIGKTVSIADKGYTAQDVKGAIDVNLGRRDLKGKLEFKVNTGDALAKDGNTVASARLTVTNGTKTTEAAKAIFDGKKVYLDASKAFEAFGATTPTDAKLTYKSDFSWDFYADGDKTKEPEYTATSLVDALNHGLKGIKYTEPVKKDNQDDKQEPKDPAAGIFTTEPVKKDNKDDKQEPKDPAAGIFTTIYNILVGKDNKWTGEAPATLGDVIELLDKKIGSGHANGSFLKFALVDANGKALDIGDIGANIVKIHNDNKAKLTESVNAEGTEAGATLIGKTTGDKKVIDLVDYVAAFIKLPKLETVDGKVQFVKKDNALVPDEINKDMIAKYIELAFEQYPADGQYADYINSDLVRRVCGMSYSDIIANGLYAYARYEKNEGLSGYIGLRAEKASKLEDCYIEIGGSIGLEGSSVGDYCAMPAEFEGCTDFFAIKDGTNEGAKDHYLIFDFTWKLFDAFLLPKAA